MPKATDQQIADQRRHLANVAEVYADLIAGRRDWRSFAATPKQAEALAWKRVEVARDLLHVWTNDEPIADPATQEKPK
jgi:hypothetical protein